MEPVGTGRIVVPALNLDLHHHGVGAPSGGLGEEMLCTLGPVPTAPQCESEHTGSAGRIEVFAPGASGRFEIQRPVEARRASFPYGVAQHRAMAAIAGVVNKDITATLVHLPPTHKTRIGHRNNRYRRETPHIALVSDCAVEFIDPPVVCLVQFESIGSKGCVNLRQPAGGAGDLVGVVTKIDVMSFGAKATRPGECRLGLDKFGAVGRIGFVAFLGGNPEAPDVSFPRTVWVGIVDLIYSPVVGRSRCKPIRDRKSGETYDQETVGLIALESALGSGINILEVVAYVNVVRNCQITRRPLQIRPCVLVHDSIIRNGSASQWPGRGACGRDTLTSLL